MQKISILITVYNKQDYIKRCLESLNNQDYENKEIIIIDNGSTDQSLELIKETKSQLALRAEVIALEENRGVAYARNFGLKQANGEYVLFLDGDDYLVNNSLLFIASLMELSDAPILMTRMQKSNRVKPITIYNASTFNWKETKRKKALKRMSVAGVLYSNAFLKENQLTFNDDFHYYTDFDFMINTLKRAENVTYLKFPLYIKGECYDPIERPSLSIEPFKNKFNEWVDFISHQQANLKEETDFWLKEYITKWFLRTYFKEWAKEENRDLFKANFEELQQKLEKVDDQYIENSGRLGLRQIRAHLSGDIIKTEQWLNKRVNIANWKAGLKNKKKLNQQIANTLFSKIKTRKNRVLFESFGGKSYACSPRAIYEEMYNEKGKEFEYIWAFSEPSDKTIPGPAKKVKRLSLKYYYYAATSKFWVMNARKEKTLDKRKETVYLQTWHGTPLKRLAADMKEVKMPGTSTATYKQNFYNETQDWDYLVSPNDYSTEIFKRAFHFEKKMLDVGYPRNDLFYNPSKNNSEYQEKLKVSLGLPKNKKIILYAPTWRDDEFIERGKYKFDVKLDLFDMRNKLGDEYVILLRMHYLIADDLNVDGLEGFVYNLSHYDDISELYLISDLLITDYSSVFFDYANLKRPIIFYTYDLDNYRDDLRGFYIDFEQEAPGPLLRTSDEVIKAIQDIEAIKESYKQRVDDFYTKFCHLDDGTASRKIIDQVIRSNR
ncbi:bifunctional glycosyltransferase/CDP-glycerol:glycerophosphate glycerophosphotransferase [Shouchella patagoniensis]|uniref:bifunctional glycosyltransferase/CDP-glycerol:glycerophosphate glycerophosphotransferase n=1 Tax=Shouchella patagoniensis TaxID=228576 RepID=UPI001474F1FF|nr:bifunctional glycosyltransferase family 2 protein/CDP-glycerol:glycerophosphate glycerophosphotransferase [Shouchella patagoniensis]